MKGNQRAVTNQCKTTQQLILDWVEGEGHGMGKTFKDISGTIGKLGPVFITKYYFVLFRLLEVRGRLYELLTHCIPPEIIMKVF